MTLKKLFGMIEEEFKAHYKYKEYAESFREIGYPEVASIFEKLSEMEFKHALWLKRIYQYFGGK